MINTSFRKRSRKRTTWNNSDENKKSKQTLVRAEVKRHAFIWLFHTVYVRRSSTACLQVGHLRGNFANVFLPQLSCNLCLHGNVTSESPMVNSCKQITHCPSSPNAKSTQKPMSSAVCIPMTPPTKQTMYDAGVTRITPIHVPCQGLRISISLNEERKKYSIARDVHHFMRIVLAHCMYGTMLQK